MSKTFDRIEEKEQSSVKFATVVGIISVILNLVLGVSKITIGRIMGFDSVFSDGIHGTGDVLTTLIATISVWVAASKKSDKYNYGHERWASIAGIVLAVILFGTALEIVTEATTSLIEGEEAAAESVAYSTLWWVSMGLSIGSVVIKFIMFFVTLYGAKKAHSTAMRADAFHQSIDAFSSIAAIIALLGYIWLPENNILDPILSYPIAIMVIAVGVETFKKSANELTDKAVDAETLENVKETIYEIVPKDHVKLIKSRIYADNFYLDIYLLADENKTLKETDEIADVIKEKLFEKFEDLKDVYVIIEPDDEEHRIQED